MLSTQWRFSPAQPWQRFAGWLFIHLALGVIWWFIAYDLDWFGTLTGALSVVLDIGATCWLGAAVLIPLMWFTSRQRFGIPVVVWTLIFFTALAITAAFD